MVNVCESVKKKQKPKKTEEKKEKEIEKGQTLLHLLFI